MSKKYFLTACLFWACSVATAQVMLPAYQGVFGKKSVTGTVPSAPSSPVASSGYKEATVSFTASVSNGGNVITGYAVTSTTGGFTASGEASPITVTGLSNGTSYIFNVVATNALGNSLASPPSISIKIFTIGTPYQGGKLAYIFTSLDPGYVDGEGHGLIAATSDQSLGTRWHLTPFGVTGATGTAIGTGSSNTDKIIEFIGATTSYAAGLARAHRGGGYTDWYLPSKEELNKLYLERVAIGGFGNDDYWSSSESSFDKTWYQHFVTNDINFDIKHRTNRVRAVRTF